MPNIHGHKLLRDEWNNTYHFYIHMQQLMIHGMSMTPEWIIAACRMVSHMYLVIQKPSLGKVANILNISLSHVRTFICPDGAPDNVLDDQQQLLSLLHTVLLDT